jgi:tRNA threonylcarbamoyladenosine biosynthesis protein TsaE
MAIPIFKTAKGLQSWGATFAKRLRPGDVIALIGTLGAGKTTLVQGITRGRGYRRRANSPTFALVNEYHSSRENLLHMDVYRLTPKEAAVFPFEEYLEEGAICLIEWADRMRARWPRETLELRLSAPTPATRKIEIHAPSPAWKKRLKDL